MKLLSWIREIATKSHGMAKVSDGPETGVGPGRPETDSDNDNDNGKEDDSEDVNVNENVNENVGDNVKDNEKKRTIRPAGALQVRDLIKRLTACRKELHGWRQAAEARVQDPRARFLLDYIASHETHIEACLAEYSSEKANALLDTWIPYGIDASLLDAIPAPGLVESNISVEGVIEATLRVDRALMDVYGRLASAPLLPPRVRELFRALLELETSKERAIALAALDV